MKYKLKYSDTWITIAAKPFAGGGEGNLYVITSPSSLKHYVAKLYHPHKLSPIRAEKINYLAQFPPIYVGENLDEHPPVVWVKDALYDGDKFVGFIMPYTHGEKLEILCTPKIPTKLSYTWGRFDFKNGTTARDLRLKLCFNICAAIHQIHSVDKYVLVDMKPDNIVIQPNGLVSIVDTDSVEVIEDGKSIFDATAATPEYTPPEFYLENLDHDPTAKEAWDRFGLGVILYKLLFGIHPFAASSEPPFDDLTGLHDKIKHGLFVHHPTKQKSFTVIPPPHKGFYQIDENLQALFLRCFVEGHDNPDARPTAEEWCATILLALDDEAAYQRYGHILNGGIVHKKPRFPLPSSRMVLPEYPESLYKLLELNQEKELPQPKLAKLIPSQMEKFDLKPIPPVVMIGLLVLFGILSAIGTPILGGVALLYVWNKMYQDYKEDGKYKLRKILAMDVKKMKTEHYYKNKSAKSAQRNFQKIVRKIIPNIEESIKKIKQEIEGLRQFILKQDERVKNLETKAIEQYNALNKKYAEEAQSNRILARMSEGKQDNLSKIKIAINQSYKKAVDLLIKEKPISEDHPDIQDSKISIDALVRDKKLKITDLIGEKAIALQEKFDEKLANLHQTMEKRSDLLLHLERLWAGGKIVPEKEKIRVKELLESKSFLSVNQIYTLNAKTGWIDLKNGTKVNLVEFYDYKTVTKNLQSWFEETKRQMTDFNKAKAELKQEYQQKLKELEDQKRIDLKGLEKIQQEEMQKVKVVVQRTILGEPFSNLQQDYEAVNQYVVELEKEFVQEEEVLLQDYKQDYENILEECKNKIATAEKNIRTLEENLQKHQKKVNDSKVQKQFKEYEEELQELKAFLPRLERKDFEYKKLENITFSNYVKTLLGREV